MVIIAPSYEIFSARDFHGITTAMPESMLEGQNNQASGKISYMRKVLSAVLDYAFSFEQL